MNENELYCPALSRTRNKRMFVLCSGSCISRKVNYVVDSYCHECDTQHEGVDYIFWQYHTA